MESADEDALLSRLKSGESAAATEIFNRFASRLVALARGRIDLDLRRKVDPEDIVQSVFLSFFRRKDAGEIEFTSLDSLWSLLAVITVHKCGHRIRYYRAARRNASEEQSAVQFTDDSAGDWEAIANDPTPSQAAILAETVEALMRPLTERERQIVALSLQGHTVEMISKDVQRSRRTVRRVLDRVRSDLEVLCTSDA